MCLFLCHLFVDHKQDTTWLYKTAMKMAHNVIHHVIKFQSAQWYIRYQFNRAEKKRERDRERLNKEMTLKRGKRVHLSRTIFPHTWLIFSTSVPRACPEIYLWEVGSSRRGYVRGTMFRAHVKKLRWSLMWIWIYRMWCFKWIFFNAQSLMVE